MQKCPVLPVQLQTTKVVDISLLKLKRFVGASFTPLTAEHDRSNSEAARSEAITLVLHVLHLGSPNDIIRCDVVDSDTGSVAQ